MSEAGAAPEREGGWVVLLMLLGLGALLAGGYAAAHLAAGDRIPRDTTIAGVEVGGRRPQEALVALRRGLSGRAAAPLQVRVDGRLRTVLPADAGLRVDYAASIAVAGGRRSWSPDRLWDYYTGGENLPAVVRVDEDRLTGRVARLAAAVGTRPTEGAVRFRAGRVVVTEPEIGSTIDTELAAQLLRAAYLGSGDPVELDLVDVRPQVDRRDVADALDAFANPAVSGPVTLRLQSSRVRLQPREFTSVLWMKRRDGGLAPRLAVERLDRLVARRLGRGHAPRNATVRLLNGSPRVIPSQRGVGYDPRDVSRPFLWLVTRPAGRRELRIPPRVRRPDVTTADARRLRIRERVSTFTTYFPYAEYRNVNIGRAAQLINGTLLTPGETFSLNGTVGERTKANGFTEGFVISDGIFKEDLGGGVSQVATTTFNAAFFAGLEDVEHKPHSFYIDRYPEGREATVAWGSVDLRFRNDTPYGVLVQASVRPSTPSSTGAVTVSMWSTKYWDITTSTSDRYAFTQPETRVLRTEDCVPNEGYGGFDVDVTRYFRRAGSAKLVRREVMHTTYLPADTVVCRPPG